MEKESFKLIDIERTILEAFMILSNTSMAASHIYQFVRRKYPYVTKGQIKKSLTNLEEKKLLSPATYSLNSIVYPIKDFVDMCTLGHIINDDGSGFLLTEDLEEGDQVNPSKIRNGHIPPGNFVVWYNK
jgi:hypothetical protein